MSAVTSQDILAFEGLVKTTAGMFVGRLPWEYDDLAQVLRVKVWQALESYDPAKSRSTRERYVFSCLTNKIKDLKRDAARGVKRQPVYIEDQFESFGSLGQEHVFTRKSRDHFELRYLSATDEQVFAGVLDEAVPLPGDLGPFDVDVLVLMMMDLAGTEIAFRLNVGITRIRGSQARLRRAFAAYKPEATDDSCIVDLAPPQLAAVA